MTGPEPTSPALLQRLGEEWRRIRRRWLTIGGNRVQAALGNGVTSLAVTLPRAEVDDQYGVLALPTWDTTVYLQARTATGFELHFGTATPDDQQTVDWATFRTED